MQRDSGGWAAAVAGMLALAAGAAAAEEETARVFLVGAARFCVCAANDDAGKVAEAALRQHPLTPLPRRRRAVEAFYPLQIENESLQLWLVGDGLGRAELEHQAKMLEIADRVHFWGYQEETYPYLVASDIFVLPSSNEAMPVSLLEALACGLPCMATRVGENQRTIEHGKQGLLIPPLDCTALTQALRQLIDSTDLRQQMSQAALERASGFGDQHMVEQMNTVYDELLHHKS